MSDRMRPIPFERLLNWIITEYRTSKTVFGVRKQYRHTASGQDLRIFGETPELPIGPAAGPNTQLAQNIAAAYFAGARFFELKTVQKIDGEDLPVSKPCILAEDEGYNVEWSTELTVPEAYAEYVKAWWLCGIMALELGLGSPRGFVFNMSVGYDLEGIRSPKIDSFIEGLKDASNSPDYANVWNDCLRSSLRAVESGLLRHVTAEDVHAVSPMVCRSATLSTLHGCPAEDIERIASYLLSEKHLNTFIKCNPTLLGYEYTRSLLDEMGYDYICFGRFHFEDDLQYEAAVPMLHRLKKLADGLGLEFGVKLTNTFPVDIRKGELPGNEMYMSGRALYPLSISLAQKLSRDFEGTLRISFSGGADAFNLRKLLNTGIWPVTFATTILKPGGYNRITQLAEQCCAIPGQTDLQGLSQLAASVRTDPHHTKPVKTVPLSKSRKSIPLFDCFMSPCSEGCPISQDITAYMRLVDEGRYLDALKVIALKNPLPNITGTICAHPCMSRCTRRFYEDSVKIRSKKLTAAKEAGIALEKYLGDKSLHDIRKNGIKTAVIGAGPAGISSAFFLARAGFDVTVFEKRESGGGTVGHVITEQRIGRDAIAQDIAFTAALGARFIYDREIRNLEELKKEGFQYVIVCTGACLPRAFKLPACDVSGDGVSGNDPSAKTRIISATEFLERIVRHDPSLKPGKNTVIIGAGNTAMDAARAAKTLFKGTEAANISIVYRRDRRNMPALEEELRMTLAEGIIFRELLSPFAYSDGKLFCKKNILGDHDASGRQIPIETDETVIIPADMVIAATGEMIDAGLYEALEIETGENGFPITDSHNQSMVDRVYIAGDGRKGPSTIVEAIRDAAVATDDIIRRCGINTDDNPVITDARSIVEESMKETDTNVLRDRKGILVSDASGKCLGCDTVCENCADVCPNRANIAVSIPGHKQPRIIHIDDMCNECGNCAAFCPYSGSPYKDKFTLFSDLNSFIGSTNQGFILLDPETCTFRVRYGAEITDEEPFSDFCSLDDTVKEVIKTVYTDHGYLFDVRQK